MGGTHTRDTEEKGRKSCFSIPAASFSPLLVTRVADKTKNIKFKWGQSVVGFW